MSDLRQTLRDWRAGMALLGYSGDTNWQSIAVLMSNTDDSGQRTIRRKLLDPSEGWCSHGVRVPDYRCSGTSLYISPKGMVYWLHYGGHTTLYHDIMRCSQGTMDRAGWLHISGGRVDICSRMSEAQIRWLDAHKPNENAENSLKGDWRIYDGKEHVTRDRMWNSIDQPNEYAKADPFDVRPIPGFDLDNDEHWERLMLRIERAKPAPVEATEPETIGR